MNNEEHADFLKRLAEAEKMDNTKITSIFELHQKMTAHLFPAFSSTDERFLTIALCGEAGELANFIKKQWRDKVDLGEPIRDEIADIRVYLELLARCFNIDGDKLDNLVSKTFVVEAHSDDERFISLALCSRVGRLADVIETRWSVNDSSMMRSAAQNTIVNIRIYLEMMAKIFNIEGKKLDHRVEQKLAKVIQKHGIKMGDNGDVTLELKGATAAAYARPKDTLR